MENSGVFGPAPPAVRYRTRQEPYSDSVLFPRRRVLTPAVRLRDACDGGDMGLEVGSRG